MLIRFRQLALAAVIVSAGLTIAGCKAKSFGARNQETINLSQVPVPVKATIDQQAQGRSVGDIAKQTAKGTTRYAVTFGSGNQKQELLIDEGGKVIATNTEEDDDD